MDRIYQPLWISLQKEVRVHLEKVFSIPTSGVNEIRDQEVISDGKTNQDLLAISASKMAEYVGSPESEQFHRLWELTLAKVKYELNPPMYDLSEMSPVTESSICDTCDTKSKTFHKKGCPKLDK